MRITGKKLKMSQIFEKNVVIPVTVIKVENAFLKILEKGETLKVRGITKGKGFQGVVKRHGFKGGPKSHGQKDRHRAPGSIGATGAQRVIKGMRMAGRMGGERRTLKRIEVIAVEPDQGILLLKGSLPGNNGSKIEMYKNSTNNESNTNKRTSSEGENKKDS